MDRGANISLFYPGLDLEDKVDFLRQPQPYGNPIAQVETVETHMSWVFLIGDLVYKLKKPVYFDFLDFRTLDARHWNCKEEVRLNHRLAPEVYLDVVPLVIDDKGHLQLNGKGEIVDWLVKMRRLPATLMLDYLIHHQSVDEQDIRKFALKLATFYHNAEPIPITEEAYRQRLQNDILANQKELLEPEYQIPVEQLIQITHAQLDLLDRKPELFNERVQEKRIIEAHGDLRPEHICLLEDPVFIDCLEFKREFRILDPVHELAYLAVECEYAGADIIGPIVFDTYCHETGDDAPQRLIHFYKAYRATLRAKFAIWHLKDHELNKHSKWIRRAKANLQLAGKYSDLLAR